MTPDDARFARLHEILSHRPVASAPRVPGMREAAVALLLRPRQQLELLLIKRSQQESDPWSGQMALPGGRREPLDEDLLAVAMRETREEVRVDTRRADLLGALDEVTPRTSHLPPIVIAPFVLAVPSLTRAQPHPAEVDAALWVPLRALADEGAAEQLILELEGGRRTFPAYRYGEHIIWGLTQRILEQFLAVAAQAGVVP